MFSATFLPYSVDPAALVFIPVLNIKSCRWDLRPNREETERQGVRDYLAEIRDRIAREAEAEKRHQEYMARWERERKERRAKRAAQAAHYKKMDERRAQLHAALKPEFDAYGGRNKWIWHQHQAGLNFREIGDRIGLHRQRVNQIYDKVERIRARRAEIAPFEPIEINRGRPIDMGGPRDVWLTYLPSHDPRFDNMVPSNGR